MTLARRIGALLASDDSEAQTAGGRLGRTYRLWTLLPLALALLVVAVNSGAARSSEDVILALLSVGLGMLPMLVVAQGLSRNAVWGRPSAWVLPLCQFGLVYLWLHNGVPMRSLPASGRLIASAVDVQMYQIPVTTCLALWVWWRWSAQR